MMSFEEIEVALKSAPCGYKQPFDDFFKTANEAYFLPFKKLGVITSVDEEETVDAQSETKTDVSKDIFCNIYGCELVFDNVADYQTHFNTVHRYSCTHCRRSYAVAHLLDLHVSEKHDSFFAAKVERGVVPMFACLLKECEEKMFSTEARREHCITEHKFPSNYRLYEFKSNVDALEKKAGSSTSQQRNVSNEHANARVHVQQFSFGHQRERAFQSDKKNKTKNRKKGATLENMNDLKMALE